MYHVFKKYFLFRFTLTRSPSASTVLTITIRHNTIPIILISTIFTSVCFIIPLPKTQIVEKLILGVEANQKIGVQSLNITDLEVEIQVFIGKLRRMVRRLESTIFKPQDVMLSTPRSGPVHFIPVAPVKEEIYGVLVVHAVPLAVFERFSKQILKVSILHILSRLVTIIIITTTTFTLLLFLIFTITIYSFQSTF